MKKETNDNKSNNRLTIQQTVLKYELIYLVKIIVFILITFTVFIDISNPELCSKDNLIGTFTFVLSTTIDCAILAKSSNVKGSVVTLHLVYIIILFLCSLFLILIFIEKLKINIIILWICNFINIFCCFSPLV